MKKITLILLLLFVYTTGISQQIGNGYATIIDNYSIPLNSGVYSVNTISLIPDTSFSWNHLFVIRHANANNNYQLQIASSFSENDRIFFRKLAVENLSSSNPTWIEFATRGNNTFVGNQIVNGNLDIFNYTNKITGFGDSNNYYIGYFPVSGSAGLDIHFAGGIRFGDYTSNSVMQIANGNVGIGIVSPNNKLDVNGTIHSKEVKVDMIGWSDFVLKNEYNLPTLVEVEKHIKEKGHLENIPSEEEVLKNGINLGEMNAKLLQKIEELTLYMIEMKKENIEMRTKQTELQNTVKELNNKLK